MRIRLGSLLAGATACAMVAAVPAQAARTAIDQRTNPDGTTTPTSVTVSGYCDFNNVDCGGSALGYSVSFDGGLTTVDSVTIHGNGMLMFGSGEGTYDTDLPIYQTIDNYGNPALVDYQRDLISIGQDNTVDFDQGGSGVVFTQSASLKIVDGIIKATFFYCVSPKKCMVSPRTLILAPTRTGFQGSFSSAFGDAAYVVNGQRVNVDSRSFFLPATFTGLTSAVPEPESWALMLLGFGLVGGSLRRRSTRATLRAA